jgi:hypothetical protein
MVPAATSPLGARSDDAIRCLLMRQGSCPRQQTGPLPDLRSRPRSRPRHPAGYDERKCGRPVRKGPRIAGSASEAPRHKSSSTQRRRNEVGRINTVLMDAPVRTGCPEEIDKIADMNETGLKIKTSICPAELPYRATHGLVLIGRVVDRCPELRSTSRRKRRSTLSQWIILTLCVGLTKMRISCGASCRPPHNPMFHSALTVRCGGAEGRAYPARLTLPRKVDTPRRVSTLTRGGVSHGQEVPADSPDLYSTV